MADLKIEVAGILFEWDEDKAKKNELKHGVSFYEAGLVFQDASVIEIYDSVHSIYEDRMIAIGLVKDILAVVYTERHENTIRLISARKATKRERSIYYGQFSSREK